ncbi:MAG: formyl transferase [Magnetococcales bacterium]|nr:formyl transferase [Magnetococcales bacterium]
MRIAILGRTHHLLATARRLAAAGFTIPLVGTCRAAPEYRAGEEEFARLAGQLGAVFFNDSRINSPDIVALMAGTGCDLAVSMNWLTLLKTAAIEVFPQGVLNVHGGDLPRYRGNACQSWAILNGEPRIGLCVHRMVPDALDAGDILARDFFSLAGGKDLEAVYDWFEEAIPRLCLQAVGQLADGTARPLCQQEDPRPPLRCYPRRPEDGRIDWQQPRERIHRLIRASTRPLAGAYCWLERDTRVTIWKAAPTHHVGDWLAVPGQALYAEAGDPVIACPDGPLRLLEITVAGCATADAGKRLIVKSLRNRLS